MVARSTRVGTAPAATASSRCRAGAPMRQPGCGQPHPPLLALAEAPLRRRQPQRAQQQGLPQPRPHSHLRLPAHAFLFATSCFAR